MGYGLAFFLAGSGGFEIGVFFFVLAGLPADFVAGFDRLAALVTGCFADFGLAALGVTARSPTAVDTRRVATPPLCEVQPRFANIGVRRPMISGDSKASANALDQ